MEHGNGGPPARANRGTARLISDRWESGIEIPGCWIWQSGRSGIGGVEARRNGEKQGISIALANHSLDGQWLVTSKSRGDRGRMEGGSEEEWKTGKRENE